jgi:hypothetical protein
MLNKYASSMAFDAAGMQPVVGCTIGANRVVTHLAVATTALIIYQMYITAEPCIAEVGD